MYVYIYIYILHNHAIRRSTCIGSLLTVVNKSLQGFYLYCDFLEFWSAKEGQEEFRGASESFQGRIGRAQEVTNAFHIKRWTRLRVRQSISLSTMSNCSNGIRCEHQTNSNFDSEPKHSWQTTRIHKPSKRNYRCSATFQMNRWMP